MLKLETIVVYVKDGMHRRVYATKRAPTRYYYWSNGKRIYVDAQEVTVDMKKHITT